MDRENFSTYQGSEQSEITISVNSTVLLEVFSYGSKVLYSNLLDNELFAMPEAGISYYNKSDYEGFKNKIEELLILNINEYRKLTQDCATYICNYNKNFCV